VVFSVLGLKWHALEKAVGLATWKAEGKSDEKEKSEDVFCGPECARGTDVAVRWVLGVVPGGNVRFVGRRADYFGDLFPIWSASLLGANYRQFVVIVLAGNVGVVIDLARRLVGLD